MNNKNVNFNFNIAEVDFLNSLIHEELFLKDDTLNILNKQFKKTPSNVNYKNILSYYFSKNNINKIIEDIEDKKLYSKIKLLNEEASSFFNDFFINNLSLIEKNKINKNFYIYLINNNTLNNSQTLDIINFFELNKEENKLDFMLSIKNFNTMIKLSKISKDFDPWQVISKNKDIETFWATYVWGLDIIDNKTRSNRNKVSVFTRVNFFVDNLENWYNVKTEKTSTIDLHSRIVFALASLKGKYAEKEFKSFLKSLKIDNFNLMVEDFIINEKTKSTLQDRFIKFGYFKLIEKKINIDFVNDLIINFPNKFNLFSNKKLFLKNFIKAKEENAINYENLLVEIIHNSKRVNTINGSYYEIKCHFPIKSQFLSLSVEELKEKYSLEKKDYFYNSILISDSYPSQRQASYDMLLNLVNYIHTKENINWKREVNGLHGKTTLYAALLEAILQKEHMCYSNNIIKNENLLDIFYTKLNNIEKLDVLNYLKESTEENILNKYQIKNYEIYYNDLKSPNVSTFVFILNNFINFHIEKEKYIDKNLFDEKFDTIIKKLSFFKHELIEKLSLSYNYVKTDLEVEIKNNSFNKVKVQKI